MNWLRVFGNAEASRMGQGGGQQRALIMASATPFCFCTM
jgi:hypothetical protein